MKSHSSLAYPTRLATALLVVSLANAASAATITFGGLDGGGTSSFNSDANLLWSTAGAPVAGNDYVVNYNASGRLIRTPNASGNFTFAGDSLTFGDGTTSSPAPTFAYTGLGPTDVITVNDLRFNAGRFVFAKDNLTSTLAGNITLQSGGVIIDTAVSSADLGPRTVIVTAPVGSVGGLRLYNSSGTPGPSANGTLVLQANNTFTGGVVITNGVVRIDNAGALNSTTPNTVTFDASSNGYLRLNGYSVAVGGLSTNATPGTPEVSNTSATAATLTVSNAAANTYAGTLVDGTGGGTLSLIKSAAGNLTLSGTNTYTGNTTVNEGLLNVTSSLANNNFNKVFIAAPDDTLSGNPMLTRTRAASSSYVGFGSTVVGGLNSTAEILAGTNASGSDTTLSMQWRLRTASESTSPSSPPLPNTSTPLLSEVLSLTGMGNGGDAVNGYFQTDAFVLQMSYDPALILDETLAYLATFDTTSGFWVNAVAGNFGGTPLHFNRAYISGTDGLSVGRYGVDTTNNVVWAIVNHNSQFAAVPEPSTLAMLLFGAIGMWFFRRVK